MSDMTLEIVWCVLASYGRTVCSSVHSIILFSNCGVQVTSGFLKIIDDVTG